MNMQIYRVFLAFFLSFFSIHSYAQCEAVAEQCKHQMDVLSSSLGGSVHQVLWLNDVMQLPVTLREGTRYYLASCSASSVQSHYRILDDKQGELFNSVGHDKESHAEFVATSTVNGNIEIALQTMLEKPICTAFAIGFAK